MNIVFKLKEEHAAVKKLFAEYHERHDQDVLDHILKDLEAHTTAEEETVYSVLKELDPHMVEHSIEEHNKADELILQIKEASTAAESFALFVQLEEAINHHVLEEETKLLAQAEHSLSVDELDNIGNKFTQRKEELL